MRTKGRLVVHGITGKSAVAAGDIGQTLFQLSARGTPEDIAHAVACWNAVEAVGGDPATVAELVAALRHLARWADQDWRAEDWLPRQLRNVARRTVLTLARSVLARAATAD